MKKLASALYGLPVLVVIWAILIIFAGNRSLDALEGNEAAAATSWEHHFVLVVRDETDPFWQQVIQGAQYEATLQNVALEISMPEPPDKHQALDAFNSAVLSRVDGVITYVPDRAIFSPAIDEAVLSGVPVITVESDAPDSLRNSFVGSNQYQIGYEAGGLVARALGGVGNIAVILDSSAEENSLMYGFSSRVNEYSGLNILSITSSDTGEFAAEEAVAAILRQHPDINAIYCDNALDTLSAAQKIIDLNLVGRVSIIGTEDTPEVLDYIEKGVVYATVASDPLSMGREVVSMMVSLKREGFIPAFVDIDIRTITALTVDEHRAFKERESTPSP